MAAALLFTLLSLLLLLARLSPKCLGEKRAQHVEGSSSKVLSHIWCVAQFLKPFFIVFPTVQHKFCIIFYFVFFDVFYYFFTNSKTFPFVHR